MEYYKLEYWIVCRGQSKFIIKWLHRCCWRMLETNFFLWQLWDLGDGFGRSCHQHPLSFDIGIGHQHLKDVTNIEILSPTSRNYHQHKVTNINSPTSMWPYEIATSMLMTAHDFRWRFPWLDIVTIIPNLSSTSQTCHHNIWSLKSITNIASILQIFENSRVSIRVCTRF